jgi:hypothetical protein
MSEEATQKFINSAKVPDPYTAETRYQKRSIWYRLRKQHRQEGLTEVDNEHSCWTNVNAFLTGMHALWTAPEQFPAKVRSARYASNTAGRCRG